MHYHLHLCYAVPHGKIFQIHFEIYYKIFGKGIVLNFKKEAVVSSMLTIVKKYHFHMSQGGAATGSR